MKEYLLETNFVSAPYYCNKLILYKGGSILRLGEAVVIFDGNGFSVLGGKVSHNPKNQLEKLRFETYFIGFFER